MHDLSLACRMADSLPNARLEIFVDFPDPSRISRIYMQFLEEMLL
jgi:hypothetical protein